MSRGTMLVVWLLGAALVGGTLGRAAPKEQPPAPLEPGQQPASKRATLPGVVEVDETKLARIATRVKSRIDKLHIKVTGQKIKRGEPLADLHSPDLEVAGQNLLDARRSGNRDLERIARERLLLWGMDKDQVEEILKSGQPVGGLTVRSPISGHVIKKYQVEGEYVEEGARLYDVADLSTVWVEADFKDDPAPLFLLEGQLVIATTKTFPDRKFGGQVIGPLQDSSTRRLKARFAIKNPRQQLLPGMFATVRLDVPAGPSETKDAKVKELLKERLATLHELVKVATAEYRAGRISFDRVQQATRAVLDAELEQCESDKERINVLEKIVAMAKESEKNAVQRYQTGTAAPSDALMATAARLEAEIALERAKSKAPVRSK